MIRLTSLGFVGFASSSAQIRWRLRVAALITTIGWSARLNWAMSVMGTAPVFWKAVGVSRPGTLVTISWPGLKPSLRFQSSGRIGLLAMLRGIARMFRSSRRPVSVVASATVK